MKHRSVMTKNRTIASNVPFVPTSSFYRGDEGWSVATALALGLVATLMATTAMYFALGDFGIATRYRTGTAALAAAETGIDQYLTKLEADPQYWALPPSQRDPAYFPGELTWTAVPEGQGEYKLEVTAIPTPIGKPARVSIISTGRVNGVVRSIQVELERKQFLDWMYFTDFEAYTPQENGINCLTYNQAPPDCGAIDFVSQDVLRGPIKSNDWIRYCGTPTFQYAVESGRGGVYRAEGCGVSGSPTYQQGPPKECGKTGTPCPSEMPISNAKLLQDAEQGGYVYQGPVEITPLPNGKIRVYSTFGNVAVANGPARTRTLQQAPPTSPLNEWNPPPNGVIYVSNMTTPQNQQAKVYVGGTVGGGLTIGSAYRIFVWKSINYADTSSRSRDVLGLISNESIIIGDDRVGCSDPRKRPQNPTVRAAMLALNGDIRAWGIVNPPDPCTDPGDGEFVNGTLTYYSALAQKWRGVVGTYQSSGGQIQITRGYAKDYRYDERLRYVQPPRFMEPTNTSWNKLSWREIPPKKY